MSAVSIANPHLPAPPRDGQHVWSEGPTDLGGNRRCTLCGAYRGSKEAENRCLGEFRESSKMRRWAAERWAVDRAAKGGPLRALSMIVARAAPPVRESGVLHTHSPVYSLLLTCGHERIVDYDMRAAAESGQLSEVACLACAEPDRGPSW